jgi:hypothetical protein
VGRVIHSILRADVVPVDGLGFSPLDPAPPTISSG